MTLGYFRDYKKYIVIITVSEDEQAVFKKLFKKLTYLRAGGHKWHTEISNYDRFIKDIQLFPGVAENKKTEEDFEREYLIKEATKKANKKKLNGKAPTKTLPLELPSEVPFELPSASVPSIVKTQVDPISDEEESDDESPIGGGIPSEPSVCTTSDSHQLETIEQSIDDQPKVDQNDKIDTSIEYERQIEHERNVSGQLKRELKECQIQLQDLRMKLDQTHNAQIELRSINEQLKVELVELRSINEQLKVEQIEQRKLKPTIQEERELMRGSIQLRTYNKSSNADKIDYYKQLGKVHLSDIDEPSSSDEEEDDHYMERPKPKQRRNREDVDQLRRKIQELEVRRR